MDGSRWPRPAVDPENAHESADEQSFYDWLAQHHGKADEVWLQIHKVNSGLVSVTPKQAIDVARLIQEGRMTAHGLEHVEAAKADGRRDRAYGSGKAMKIPDDLLAAIGAEPKARKILQSLSEQNRFALAFRVHNMKTAAGRQKKIAALVDMLSRGETIYPQRK